MTLTSNTVECPECHYAFLAPHQSPGNPVQCPHCGAQSLRGRCREVDTNEFGQTLITNIRTEEEENAVVAEATRSQQLKMLVFAGVTIVAVGIGCYAAFAFVATKGHAAEEAKLRQAAEEKGANEQAYQRAFAVAKEALGQPDWQQMINHVRAPERAQPLADWLYQREAYEPYQVTGYKFPQEMVVGNDKFVRLFLYAKEVDRGFWVRLVEESDTYKLDWEALGRYTREHWNYFMDERPTEAETYRVHIQRSSFPDRIFFERGFEGGDDAFGVRIWSLDGGLDVHTVVPAQSTVGNSLADSIRWEVGEGFIVKLRWPAPSSDSIDAGANEEIGYRFVELVEVLQPGWHIDE